MGFIKYALGGIAIAGMTVGTFSGAGSPLAGVAAAVGGAGIAFGGGVIAGAGAFAAAAIEK